MNRTFFAALLLAALVAVQAASSENAMTAPLRIASVQMPVDNDIQTNLDRILRHMQAAKADGARVAVFPESALSGFVKEAIENLDWERLQSAESAIAEEARRLDIYAIYGTATPSGHDRPYNSGVVVGPDGEEVHRYHKMVPEGWFEPGDHLAYFEIDGTPCTMIICHDNRYPELVRIPAIKGAQVCFYISYEINSLSSAVNKIDNYRAQLIARAAENGIFVIQANGIGSPPGHDGVVLGHSRMVGPDGIVITEAPGMREVLQVETIDPSRASRGNAKKSLNIGPLQDWWVAGLNKMEEPAAEAEPPAGGWETKVRVAQMQTVPEKWNLEKNFVTFLKYADEAGAENADIFITPEGWLDGYASDADDVTTEKMWAASQDLKDSTYLQQVAAKAREHDMWICFGFTSREDGRIHNAAGLWNRQGELAGVYHKTHLQRHDLVYSPGMGLPVFESEWGPLGIVICADRRWPETIRTLRLKGAKLILNPTYGMHHLDNEWWMRTRGYENQCYVAFTHPEVGFIAGPKGELVAKRDDGPGIVVTELDLTRAKDDNHIRDRRPEIYGEITNIENRYAR